MTPLPEPISQNMPEELMVAIEIPQGSNVKYEVDEDTGRIIVDRILFTSMSYPANYGYITGTMGEDNDPIDILVISSVNLSPGVFIKAKPIGVLEMTDEAGIDAKIMAVPLEKVDPITGSYSELKDVPQITLDRIKHFFEHYKDLEPGKWVKVKNYQDAKSAVAIIKKGIK